MKIIHNNYGKFQATLAQGGKHAVSARKHKWVCIAGLFSDRDRLLSTSWS